MPKVGDRIEVTGGQRNGKTGTVVEVFNNGDITVKLDQPETFPGPIAAQLPGGISSVDHVRLNSNQYRLL